MSQYEQGPPGAVPPVYYNPPAVAYNSTPGTATVVVSYLPTTNWLARFKVLVLINWCGYFITSFTLALALALAHLIQGVCEGGGGVGGKKNSFFVAWVRRIGRIKRQESG